MPKALNPQEVYRLQREASAQRQLAEAQAGPGANDVTPTVILARRDEALVNLLLYTGLRVSEVAALQMRDVVLSDRRGKVIGRAGKVRKYREIPLHKEARKALEAYLAVRPMSDGEEATTCSWDSGAAWGPGGFRCGSRRWGNRQRWR